VVYVLFGKRARKLFWPVLIVLAGLVIMTGTFNWVIWMMLIYLMGRVYAEPLDDVTPIKGWRRNVAIITLGIFILVFVPIPLRLMV
jgi:hypothetical protein